MIPDITELNFPKIDGKQYATLTQATANIADMGEKNITTQVKIDGEIVPDFSFDWEVEFQGEKYIMPLRIPQGAKENTSLNSTIDLTFQHWAIYQLKRWPFVTIQQIAAGTYLPDEEVATVQLNLKDFCILFGQVLEYYYGGTITIDLNPSWQYKQEATIITISHTKIWNVLIDAFHDKYGVRWEIKAAADNSNSVKGGEKYVIRVGYPTTEVDHIFEYGFEGGLLKVERQVQSEEIRNVLKGRGGETNIPRFYFKQVPETEKEKYSYRDDPDWVEELRDIYFPNLMPATFRSYVQGWKAAHVSKYPGYKAVGESNTYAPWAYRKGYTDTKFSPVEFVADEITINPTAADRQVEILPGYSPYVKKGSSLDMYGPLMDTLDNDDDTYPTLQGTGMDIAVAVEQVTDASPEEAPDVTVKTVPGSQKKVTLEANARDTVTTGKVSFEVPQGRIANLLPDAVAALTNGDKVEVERYSVRVFTADGRERPASGIPAGEYRYDIEMRVHNMTSETVSAHVGASSARLQDAELAALTGGTFDIWVKNIWNSARMQGETDTAYSERVWKPVFGDREGNVAKVMFTSGALAHEDYEFTIVGFPSPDTSKTWKDANGVTHTSHWRIKLAKSDAELEATGLYVPSAQKQGKSGDTFVFTGTEMTHIPYVVDAEIRLDDLKKDRLGELRDIKPTFVVTTDRVRINGGGRPDALINQLRVGNSITLQDKRLIGGSQQVNLYLQSITYTYREPTGDDAALNPDVELVLSNDYATSANPVTLMQGEISALQRQIGSLSNIEQAVRAVGDSKYLRKNRSDRTPYALTVGGLLTAENGAQGAGYASGPNGSAWGVDAAGNMGVESIDVRSFMRVMELIVNRQRIEDADSMLTEGDTIEGVEELTGAGGTLRSFKLRLREEWEGYRTAQVVNNVLRGVYNDLTGSLTGNGEKPLNGVRYATSWMKVTKVEAARNEITVTLYADADCPAAVNFAPVAGMKVARWGNSGTSETDRPRQRLIYLSSTEGRIVMRDHVMKPKTDTQDNVDPTMEICLGTVPEFLVNAETGVGKGDYALYVKTLIAERIVKRPHGGLPEPELRYRGPYDPSARYYDGTELREETGDYERSIVSDRWGRWACDKSSGTDSEGNVVNTAPSPDGTAWTLVEPVPAGYTDNLLPNSDFSKGEEGWSRWKTAGDLPSGDVLELTEHGGKTWAHVRSAQTAYLGFWRTLPVSAGGRYTLSFLARKLGGAGRMAAYAWFLGADGAEIDGTRVTTQTDLTVDAARHAARFTAPEGAAQVALRLGDILSPPELNELEFTEVKLEAGYAVETAWTPNAADLKGEDGKPGKGISGVTNEYAVSASGTAAPTTGWQTAVPQTTATNRYLWNRETIVYTDTTSETTQPRVIGMYSEDGRGIASVTEHYLATAQASGVTKATAGWTEAVQAVTATKKYLWNYETIAYTKGAPTETSPVIIGTYGDKGDPGADGADYAPNLLAGTLPMDGVGYGTDYPGTNLRTSAVTDGVRTFRQECVAAGSMGSWMFLTALVDGGTVEDVFAAGREVTVSLECRSTAGFRMYLSTRSTAGGVNHGAVPNTVFAADASWHRVQATGVCTTQAGDDRLLFGINLLDNCPAGSWLEFRKICVSAGRQGQWVPAASEMEGGRGVESIAKWWMSTASGTPPANPGSQYGQWESEASATDFGEDEPYLWSVTVTRYTDGEETVGNPVLEARWSKDGKDAHQYLLRVTPASVYVGADGATDPSALSGVTATVDGEDFPNLRWKGALPTGYAGYVYSVWGVRLGTGTVEETSAQPNLGVLAGRYSSLAFRLHWHDGAGVGPVLAEAVLAFNRQGPQGHVGAYVPPPRPYSDYADGYVFLDGKTDVTVGEVTHPGRERVDVVLVWDSAGNHYVPWTCVKSHALDRSLTPSSSGWGTYWESDGGTWTQIATQVLLAQNAYIDLLSSRGIRVYDSNGNIVGALSSAQDTKVAGDIFLPFWLGGVMNQDGTFATNPNFGVGADGTIYCGGFNTGRRIRISGADKRMQVFDNSGREVVTIEGTAHPVGEGTEGLVEIFKAKSDLGTLELSNSTASAKSTTVELGTVTIPAGGGRYDVAMEAVLQAQTYTYVSGWRDPAIDGGTATAIKAQAASTARVELGIYQDGARKAFASAQLAGTTVGASELAGVPTGSETYGSSQRVSVSAQLAAGTYTVKAVYTLTGATGQHVASQGATAVTVTAKAGATKRPVAYHSFTPTGEGERSELGSDGLVVRRSPVHFMRAGRVTDIGFVAEAQSEGFGMRVTPHGLQTRTGGNPWQSAPVTLCAGKINMHYATWEVYGADCCVSASGKAPQLAHTTDGDLEIMDIPGLAAGPENMFDPRNLVVQVTLAEPETESVHPMMVSARYDRNRGGVLITCRDTGWGKTSWTNIWVEVRLFPYAARN